MSTYACLGTRAQVSKAQGGHDGYSPCPLMKRPRPIRSSRKIHLSAGAEMRWTIQNTDARPSRQKINKMMATLIMPIVEGARSLGYTKGSGFWHLEKIRYQVLGCIEIGKIGEDCVELCRLHAKPFCNGHHERFIWVLWDEPAPSKIRCVACSQG